jgi:hypothetical protein
MGLLDSLIGSPQAQQEMQNYVQRYQQGAPHEGYSDQEVLQRYQQVAPQLPAQDFQKAAEQSFNNMPPDQRAQFGQYVAQQLQAQGNQAQPNPQQYQNAGYLAQQTTQLQQQQPDLLSSVVSNPAVKAALAGIAANAISNAIGGRR